MTTPTANASSLDGYLGHFEEMKSVHTQEMLKLNDIGQALARCKNELEATQEKSKEDETSWLTLSQPAGRDYERHETGAHPTDCPA